MSSCDFPAKAPEYIPTPHVIASSRMTAVDLVYYFNDFYTTLHYVTSAPGHVFERLVTNLSSSTLATPSQGTGETDSTQEVRNCEHAQPGTNLAELSSALSAHIAAIEKRSLENKELQLANDQLRAELAEAKSTLSTQPVPIASSIKPNVPPNPSTDQAGRILDDWGRVIAYPVIRTYHTRDAEELETKEARAWKKISFTRIYTAPPRIPKGLTSLHLPRDSEIDISCYANDTQHDSCTMVLYSSNPARLLGTDYSWLEFDPNDTHFQCGYFSTLNTQWSSYGTNQSVQFPRSYSEPPQVVVWFCRPSLKSTSNLYLCTYPADVTATSFMLQINGLQNEDDVCGVWWAAYTAGMPGVSSGSIESSYPYQPSGKRYIEFGNGVFATPPRVIMAINRIELNCTRDVAVSATVTEISSTGMTWKLDGLPENMPHHIGVSYIALT